MSLLWESIFSVKQNIGFVCENGVTHMGTYYKESQVLWELKHRVWESWEVVLSQIQMCLEWTCSPAGFSGTICHQSYLLAAEPSLWWFLFSCGKFIPLKDKWAMISLPNWGRMKAQCEQLLEQLWVKILLYGKPPWEADMVTPLSGLKPVCWAGWVPAHLLVRL